MKNKIVVKLHPWTSLTKEMFDWILDKDSSLKNKEIDLHNPILVECVETLNPSDFRVVEIEGDEYLTIETVNDVVVLVPKDLERIKKSFVKISESCQKKEEAEEQQD